MKHVDMMLLLDRAYSETLRLWDNERRKLIENPGNRIAVVKLERYWQQLEEIKGMRLAEQRKLSKLKEKNAQRDRRPN